MSWSVLASSTLAILATGLTVASAASRPGSLVWLAGIALALGALAVAAGPVATIFASLVGAFVVRAASLSKSLGGRFASQLAISAYLVHLVFAILLYHISVAAGMGGYITTDDASYARAASAIAGYVRGEPQFPIVPPDWAGQSYLFSTWVYAVAAIFVLFGPQALLPAIVNAALAVLTAVAAGSLAARLFDQPSARIVAILVAFFPSLVLWSSLSLKDPLVVALIVFTFWCLLARENGPRLVHLLAAFGALFLTESLRSYVFVALAVVIPLAVALAPGLKTQQGWRRLALATLASCVLVAMSWSGVEEALGPGTDVSAALVTTRENMATGARTAFVTPLPSAGTEPPVATGGLLDNLRHLPIGLSYVLFAPYPWSIERPLDLLTLPEMLVWYSVLWFSVASWPWLIRRWRDLAPAVLFVVLLVGVMALAEGNVGTLFRHRAMIIPLIVLMASPAFVRALPRSLRQRLG